MNIFRNIQRLLSPLPDGRGWGWVFVLVLSLSSCTLYMDEIADAEIDPMTEVDGFEAPVTIHEDEYDMTYQFKDSVFVLTERIQKYIVMVNQDDDETRSIYFMESTPSNLLPIEGNIVNCNSSDEFPYYFSDPVESVTKENGMWRVVVKKGSPFDMFKEIHLDSTYGLEALPLSEEEAKVASFTHNPKPEDWQLDWGWDDEENAPQGAPKTRLDIDFNSNNYTWSSVLADLLTLEKVFPESYDKYLSKTAYNAKISKFSFDNGINDPDNGYFGPYVKFGLQLKPVIIVHYDSSNDSIEVSVGIDGNLYGAMGVIGEGKISGALVPPIYLWGKQIKAGPVELSLGISLGIDFSISGKMQFGYGISVPFGFKTGYREFADGKKYGRERQGAFITGKGPNISKLFQDGMSTLTTILSGFDANGSLEIALKPNISAGATIGVQIPTMGFPIEKLLEKFPGKTKDDFQDDKANGLRIALWCGPKFKFNLFNPTGVTVDWMQRNPFLGLGMYCGVDGFLRAKVWKFNLVDEEFTIGETRLPFLNLEIGNLPKIDDASFHVIPKGGTGYQQFDAMYKVKDLGLLGGLGMFRPKLAIYDGSQHFIDLDNDNDQGLSLANSKQNYEFSIHGLPSETSYTAKPLFDAQPAIRYEDQGLPFATREPAIAVSEVYQMSIDKVTVGQYYEYKYRAVIGVKGIRNIKTWGIVHRYHPNQSDMPNEWKENRYTIDKNKVDRNYRVEFTLYTYSKHPKIELVPWAEMRLDESTKSFSKFEFNDLTSDFVNGSRVDFNDLDEELKPYNSTKAPARGDSGDNSGDILIINSITPID